MNTIVAISSVLLWLVVILNLLLTFALIRKVNLGTKNEVAVPQLDMLDINAEAPEFSAQGLDGNMLTHEDYLHKERMMVFVTSTCTPCREQMGKLEELYPKAQKAGVELLIFNLESLDRTELFAKELKLTAPIFSAPKGINNLNEVYKVPGTPSYYLIDHSGKVKSRGFFDNTWQELTTKWDNVG